MKKLPEKKPANETTTPTKEVESILRQEIEQGDGKRDLTAVADRITKVALRQEYSGPIPHPHHLRQYEEVLPGAAERIMAMAEKSLESATSLEKSAQEAKIADNKVGMISGAALFFLLIASAFASLFVTSNPLVPAIFLSVPVVSGIIKLINRTHR